MAEKKTAPAEAPAGMLRPDTDYKPMNLHQKFVELRKAVPQIVKKQHSDGVKYTFAKIFDVYELLAPAMNLVGVDWDIIKRSRRGTQRTVTRSTTPASTRTRGTASESSGCMRPTSS